MSAEDFGIEDFMSTLAAKPAGGKGKAGPVGPGNTGRPKGGAGGGGASGRGGGGAPKGRPKK